MKDFTLRKRFLDCKSGTSSLFKGFVMLVVLMLMTTSSAMAQEPKLEVIDGFRYLLDSDTKTATLVPKKMATIPMISSLFLRRLRVMMG